MSHKFVEDGFLSFPIRRSLEGVSWASLSVRWTPTENQKQRRREAIESLWFLGARQEARPRLYPLDDRRFPFERFYARLNQTNNNGRAQVFSRMAHRGGFKPSAAPKAAL